MATMTREHVRAVLGPVDDGLVVEIVGTGASREELAEAYAWLTDDEAPMNAGRPPASGRVNLLVDILEAAEEEAPAAAEPSSARDRGPRARTRLDGWVPAASVPCRRRTGVVLTSVLGVTLMALVFYSDRSGRDESAGNWRHE